jgi:dihydroorotase
VADNVDLIVKNGTVVNPDGRMEADIAINDGRFVAIADRGELGLTATEEVDATGLHVLPGVIDGHVHFREPGMEYKEDWRTGSTAAVYGGVTVVLDMPNTIPRTDTAERVQQKQHLAEEKSYVDFGILGLLSTESVPELRAMADAGVVGYKCFLGETIGKIPPPTDGELLEGLAVIADIGLRVGFHAENDAIMQHLIRKMKEAGRKDPLAHVESRPAIAEVESIQRVGLYARHTGARIHIFHLASRDGLDMIDEWRAKGVDITTETGVHYVFYESQDMVRLGARLRMNPPVRSKDHGDYLFEGIKDGRVDLIASDHSPHTEEEKLKGDIWEAISGFPGVETGLKFFLTRGVNAGRMTLEQLVRATSEGPAKTWGIWPQKGAIRLGSDGDLTIVDLDKEGVIREAELHSKNHITPFDGVPFKGAAVSTIIRGQVVVRDGELVGQSQGKLVVPQRMRGAAQRGARELVGAAG